ncbi:MAG: hypothetical protein EOO41_01720 [Methanobacteriota archaeon]|nr:MAG: hypothetical protein EOO41_01720 [Euryarchaeota archaeon]
MSAADRRCAMERAVRCVSECGVTRGVPGWRSVHAGVPVVEGAAQAVAAVRVASCGEGEERLRQAQQQPCRARCPIRASSLRAAHAAALNLLFGGVYG